MVSLQEIASGASVTQLGAAAPAEAALPEQTPVQLNIRLRSGAATVAPALDWALKQAGLQPWSGSSTIATASSLSQTVTLRWTKASVGLPIIAAILAGGVTAVLIAADVPGWVIAVLGAVAVAALVLLAWTFFKRVASSVGSIASASAPYVLPALGVLGAVYVLLELSGETPYALSIRKHLEVRRGTTEWLPQSPPPGALSLRSPAPALEGGWHADRVRAARREVADRYVTQGPSRLQEGLGATPETARAFENVLEFQRARGISVRARELGSEGDGEVTLGLASDDGTAILLAPAVLAEDSMADETLLHEVAHSIAHSPACAVGHFSASYSADFDEYASSPDEVEAVSASLLAMQRLRLPLEDKDGRLVPPGEWHLDEGRMRRDLDPVTYRRIVNTAAILEQAARQGAAAAPLADICPQDMPQPPSATA